MFNNIKKWLLKPYPFVSTIKQKIFISLVYGKIVFLFLYIFRPFQIGIVEENLLKYTLGFGLITFIITLLNHLLITALFPTYFKTTTWIVGKMIVFLFGIIIMISIAYWYYNNNVMVYSTPIEKHSLIYFIFVTILVGLIPGIIFLYVNEKTKNKQHTFVADKISASTPHMTLKKDKRNIQNISITLFSENKKDILSLNTNDLLYISAESNYTNVFYISNGSAKEKLLRISLNKIESQLKNYPFVVRCHKSFIINTHLVIKMSGNARGYYLQLPDIDFQVPISRNFPKEFLYTLVSL